MNLPQNKIQERMARLGLREEDIDETFVRSSGPGGQNVNKTSTAVVVTHRPTGLQIRCEQERSQSQNRALARKLLLDKIEEKKRATVEAARAEIEKIRRQKRKRPRGVQERVLQSKSRRAEKKRFRRKVDRDY
jgi:protein subunit release factor B